MEECVSSLRTMDLSLRLILLLFFAGCAGDREHCLRISVPEQRMLVYEKGRLVAQYPVSTSKFGLGDVPGSNATPLGRLRVARKIGGGQPLGMKFKSREPTGEVVAVNAPGRDPIVTRILWLRGLEYGNRHAFGRMIYIHGTPEEAKIGEPSSYGCIRMRSTDVVSVYDMVGVGAGVEILNKPWTEQQRQEVLQLVSAAGQAAERAAQ
jgi:lipoprotein-anchoring transpeptidase ErfK/SrfK